MKRLPFKESKEASLGMELEYQMIHPLTWDMISCAKDLIRKTQNIPLGDKLKPEITQSMIEINTSIHLTPKALYLELKKIKKFLLKKINLLNVEICGGGMHPFQKWKTQKIFPTVRFKKLAEEYGCLSKQATLFGMHLHVGCKNGEDALYLTHALSRYVHQLIALSASSPFYQGIDTEFHTIRTSVLNSLPTSGIIPYITTWKSFSNYFYQMQDFGVIETMKDFHWEIRPKPEFGTVELRICDTPLTIEKAVLLAAYIQIICFYLLEEKPIKIKKELYYFYFYNRFQASRYGFDGHFIDPIRQIKTTVLDDILRTGEQLEKYANLSTSGSYLNQLLKAAKNKQNDAVFLKAIYNKTHSFRKVVKAQCDLWKKSHM